MSNDGDLGLDLVLPHERALFHRFIGMSAGHPRSVALLVMQVEAVLMHRAQGRGSTLSHELLVRNDSITRYLLGKQ